MVVLHNAIKPFQNGVFVFFIKKNENLFLLKKYKKTFFWKNKNPCGLFFEEKQVFFNPAWL